MRKTQLVLLTLALFLSGCACKVPLQVMGQESRLSFVVKEPYRIATLEVSEWNKDGQRTPKWRIEGASLEGVYYATHSADFETTYEPARLGAGVYSVTFECVSKDGKRCKREQLFAIPARDGAVLECKSRQECQSLLMAEVTAR
jgi:hypothetical protein